MSTPLTILVVATMFIPLVGLIACIVLSVRWVVREFDKTTKAIRKWRP